MKHHAVAALMISSDPIPSSVRHRLGDRHFVGFDLGPGGPLRFLRCAMGMMGDARGCPGPWVNLQILSRMAISDCHQEWSYIRISLDIQIIYNYVYIYIYNIIGYPYSPLASIGYGETVGATHGEIARELELNMWKIIPFFELIFIELANYSWLNWDLWILSDCQGHVIIKYGQNHLREKT